MIWGLCLSTGMTLEQRGKPHKGGFQRRLHSRVLAIDIQAGLIVHSHAKHANDMLPRRGLQSVLRGERAGSLQAAEIPGTCQWSCTGLTVEGPRCWMLWNRTTKPNKTNLKRTSIWEGSLSVPPSSYTLSSETMVREKSSNALEILSTSLLFTLTGFAPAMETASPMSNCEVSI